MKYEIRIIMIQIASKLSTYNLNKKIKSIFLLLLTSITCQLTRADISCTLPVSWTGQWNSHQQSNFNKHQQQANFNSPFYPFLNSENNKIKPVASRIINSLSFLDKGNCLNVKDERFFFFDNSEKCFRCLFIIQRHFNVLQYRETDCYTDLENFEEICSYLAPDLPLYTMIRAEPVPEKCPLVDSYDVLDESNNYDSDISLNAIQTSLKTLAETSNKCLSQNDDSSVITKCSDKTMLRIDFKGCNKNYQQPRLRRHAKRYENGFVARCIAHWSEGNLNYLMIKQDQNIVKQQSSLFRCMVYKDLDRPFMNTHANSVINPTNNLIKVSLSDDELCRDFYASPNNFVLKKNKRNDSIKNGKHNICVFPRFLNKKWTNLRQSKSVFSIHKNEIHILNVHNDSSNQKQYNHQQLHPHHHSNDMAFLKLNCVENVIDDSIFLVSNVHECSAKVKCLAIYQKSEFIIHLKYGHHNGHNCLFDRKNLIFEDYFSIETDTGISCPFSDRIYQLSTDLASKSSHKNLHLSQFQSHPLLKRTVNSRAESQFNLIYNPVSIGIPHSNSNCEHLLKIGCDNNVNRIKDYSINKKCQYSYSVKNNLLMKKDSIDEYSFESLPQYQALMRKVPSFLPVTESESTHICLAFWPVNQNNNEENAFIVLSKSTNSAGFRVGCSLWESYKNSNKLKISDDYMFKLCGDAVDPNEIYQRNANDFNEFYESSSKLIEDSSYVFEYRGTCSSSAQNQNFDKTILIGVFLMLFFFESSYFK